MGNNEEALQASQVRGHVRKPHSQTILGKRSCSNNPELH
jgi:hypothetical protein